MGGTFRRLFARCAAALALSVASGAQAVVITYEAIDLADPGTADRWQYRYRVSGSFVQFGGFNVLFPPALYGNLESPPPSVNNDWLIAVDQPDAQSPADGLYRAVAQFPNPSLADLFTLTFDWLGSGSPAAQTFEVYDDTGFLPIQTDLTVPQGQVALPGTLALLGLGLLALRVRKAAARPI